MSGASFMDLAASVIAYSKWMFVVVGVVAIMKAVADSQRDRPVSRGLKIAILMSVLPGCILTVLDAIGFSPSLKGSAVAAGGKSYVEYMLEQTGLLSCTSLAQLPWFGLLVVSIFFGSLATVIVRGAVEGHELKDAAKYLIPAILIAVIFNPGWQRASTNNAQLLIREIQAHLPKSAAGAKEIGPAPNSATVLPTIAKKTGALTPHGDGVPVVLADVNAGFDDLIDQITQSISADGFAEYGMAGVEGMQANIQASLPNYVRPDLRPRLAYFVDACAVPLIQHDQKAGTPFGRAWAKNPQQAMNSFDPFSLAAEQFFNHNRMRGCTLMIAGGYSFPAGATAPVPGHQFSVGIRDEILANASFSDPRVRAQFPKIQTIADAEAELPQIKAAYNSPADWRTLVTSIFKASLMAPYAQSSQLASLQADQAGTGVTGAGLDLKIAETYAVGIWKSATGAGSTQFVSMSLPIYMGSIQMILLALFPIVFALSLLPGWASSIGWYFMTLLWSKSYIIAWALISNLDHWFSTTLDFSADSSVTPGSKLAMIHTIQNLQMWSPWIMALIFFGAARVGAHAASKGAGAA